MSFGGLERGKRGAPFADINVTPLVDVMLVLVVIFIITAPLMASSLRLDLPRSDAARPAEVPRSVQLAIDASGALFVDDRPIAEAALARRLAEAAARDPATEVQLRADARVPYGRVVAVMGLAQQAGLSRIGFVAEPAR
jgi:biopolymer transport protein TolR